MNIRYKFVYFWPIHFIGHGQIIHVHTYKQLDSGMRAQLLKNFELSPRCL